MRKLVVLLVSVVLLVGVTAGCESLDRVGKDIGSSVSGLNRTLYVYDQNGDLVKEYKGKFDIEVNEYGNKVKFDLNGKRVLIYNMQVIVEEE